MVFTILGCNCADSEKEDFELQVKCRNQAKHFFEKEVGGEIVLNNMGYISSAYSNHYNKKENKCFVLVNKLVVSTALSSRKIRSIEKNWMR
jgi:hypothetical protein